MIENNPQNVSSLQMILAIVHPLMRGMRAMKVMIDASMPVQSVHLARRRKRANESGSATVLWPDACGVSAMAGSKRGSSIP